MERSCYEVLGVAPGASDVELRSAYRAKAKQLRPDLVVPVPAGWAEVDEAWRTLGDPRRRAAYDRQREQRARGLADQRRQEAERLAEERRRRRPPRPAAGQDALVRVTFSRAELTQGVHVRHPVLPTSVGPLFGPGRYRLVGQGHPSPFGGPAGDLVVEVGVEARRGADLEATERLTLRRRSVLCRSGHRLVTLDRAGSYRLVGGGAPGSDGGAPGDLVVTLTEGVGLRCVRATSAVLRPAGDVVGLALSVAAALAAVVLVAALVAILWLFATSQG